MEKQNISDIIERYLKQVLEGQNQIEIRRGEMAEQFSCVPSQINYVIQTRFTIAQGYDVESKRGGGGYIRISKVNLSNHLEILAELDARIGATLDHNDMVAILQQLCKYDIITKRESSLLYALMSKESLQGQATAENQLRSHLMRTILRRLRYEEKE